MSLDDIVQLVISKNTVSPTRLGFGTPLIMACHDVAPARVMYFKSLAGMVSAGFALTHPAYLAAAKEFSQNPRPSQVLIGKRTRKHTKTVKFTPLTTTPGDVYSFTVTDPHGVSVDVEYVVPGGATVASVCGALVALIVGVTDVVAATVGGPVTAFKLTATQGLLFNVSKLPGIDVLTVKDITADPGLAADMADVFKTDATTWYAWSLDSSSPAEIAAGAAWNQAIRKLFVANTSESDILDPGTSSDLATTLKAALYSRTALLFSKNQIAPYSEAAWLGCQLPKAPGSSTWTFKQLATITPDNFTDGEIQALEAKNCNYYTTIAGVNITEHGYTCAGTSDFLDIVHGIDWLYARIQEAVYGLFVSSEKVPYTDPGAASVASVIDAVLRRGVKATLLAKDPAPVVTIPLVKDADKADKIARHLAGVTFGGTLQGAIHSVDITGTLEP